ncbi:hypothetical protein Tco_0661519 [Tanacetum coccineum]
MDSMILIGQKNTLAEYMILSGADNRPPMLDKDLYDSWKVRMELYMQNIEKRRMILKLVEHGPFIWPTIEENRVIRTKKYAELSATKKIQADCDLKATNIILQGLQLDIYSLVNHHRVAKDLWERIQLLMQDYGLPVPVFKQGNDPIDVINKMMLFLYTVITSRFPSTNNQLRNSSNPRQQAIIHDGRVTVQPVQERQTSFYAGMSRTRANNSGTGWNNSAKAVLMANLSSYGSDVLSEVNEDNLIANESLYVELERYKERVKLPEERQNVDLSTRKKLIMDDIIQEKNAQFADFEKEINYLKQTLSEQSKEKELLTKTFNVFKNESKEKEAKNIDTKTAYEKKVKELDNIVYKMGQSTQTVHMLTKPQVFYDNNLKQALGFQNPFDLKKS